MEPVLTTARCFSLIFVLWFIQYTFPIAQPYRIWDTIFWVRILTLCLLSVFKCESFNSLNGIFTTYKQYFLSIVYCIAEKKKPRRRIMVRLQMIWFKWSTHRLNMELDLQSYLGSMSRTALYSLAETPQLPPPPPAFGLIYEDAINRPLHLFLQQASGHIWRRMKLFCHTVLDVRR